LEEAECLNVARFQCSMDPKFYDYTILELQKWIDVIERRDYLRRDLAIIN